jgi:Uma2 family endonuclease
VLKRQEYARLGIPSYWLLDVEVPSLRALELHGGEYVEIAYAEGETAVSVELPFPVTVVPAALLRL